MQGRSVNAKEKSFHNALAALGCIACRKDGFFNDHVSIHHIKGRTGPDCHYIVLPLCAPHHQHDDTDPVQRIGIHPFKARFEDRYGSQMDLLAECMDLLGAGICKQ